MKTKKYLIDEIKRFYNENDRVPVYNDMMISKGYPCIVDFVKMFGSWSNAIEFTGFQPKRKKLSGDEFCIECGTKETTQWCNSDFGKLCNICWLKQYNKPNIKYMNGLLDIDSTAGFGFLGQRIVAKKLGLELKYDCNCSVNFNHPFDLFDSEKYGRIDVKTATLKNNGVSSFWQFKISNNECDTYIMLGFNENKNDLIKIWLIKSNDNITNRDSLVIYNNPKYHGNIVRIINKYEVDVKPYNDAYHNMSLDNCSVLKRY